MRAVVFKTPGHIPLESFTTFGVNSKPNSNNPIGYFGTGLKLALAVLLRSGCDISVWVGMTEYKFTLKSHTFRDKSFDFITMQEVNNVWIERVLKQMWRAPIKLPFTTELGKNWVLWQAYRELHSNTLDEAGTIYVVDNFSVDNVKEAKDVWNTHIVVRGDQFIQEYYERHKTFLPEGLRERSSTDRLQVIDKPGGAIYYRGIRVLDLEGDRKSKFTYNILQQMELTEDRTLKDVHEAERIIAAHISQSEDKKLVGQALSGKPSLETTLPYDWGYSPPSETFNTYSASPSAPSRARSYAGYFKPTKPPTDWRALLTQYMKLELESHGYTNLNLCQSRMHPDDFKHIVAVALDVSPHNEALQKLATDLGIEVPEQEIPY